MCGIVGIYHHSEASNLAYLCLHALQHRGQESCGIVTSDGRKLHAFRAMGLVGENVNATVLTKLPGTGAIGHVRYSTSGTSELKNAQPFVINFVGRSVRSRGQSPTLAKVKGGDKAPPLTTLAIAHNGNITNAGVLRKKLEAEGAIFQSTMDTEVIMHLVARSRKPDLESKIADACSQILGAFSLVFLAADALIAVRDPKGFRPLVIGKKDGAYVAASETCALDLIDAPLHCEVEPGEMIVMDGKGMRSSKPFAEPARIAPCIFEYIYFARPDSRIFGRDVYTMRKEFGKRLAVESPVQADVVVPVPDSGVPAAIGFSEVSGIPFQMGLIRSHYVGRTFIEPEQSIRHFGVKLKLNVVREVLHGKRVAVVDDSIVRGTTCMKIVKMLREKGGAKEVHMRISSPPITWPCFYGIDTPNRSELIAANKNIDEIRKFIGADSLSYLSFEGLQSKGFCDACFTGCYSVSLPDHPEVEAMAKQSSPA